MSRFGNNPRSGDMNNSMRSTAMTSGTGSTPDWAPGLQQLYKGIVEVPVPADLDRLVARVQRAARKR